MASQDSHHGSPKDRRKRKINKRGKEAKMQKNNVMKK